MQTNANGVTTTRSYSPDRGFLTALTTRKAASPAVQDLAYTVDPAGLVTGVTSPFPREEWKYTYDDLHRLVDASNTSHPEESQTWQYDEQNRITYNRGPLERTSTHPRSPPAPTLHLHRRQPVHL